MKRYQVSCIVVTEGDPPNVTVPKGEYLLFETLEMHPTLDLECEHEFVTPDEGMQSGEPFCKLCGIDKDEVVEDAMKRTP